jgi:hypothetical protein
VHVGNAIKSHLIDQQPIGRRRRHHADDVIE